MAQVTRLTPTRLKRLETAVVDGLKERKYRAATVQLTKSGLPGRLRLLVVSPDFAPLSEAERQGVIWRVLEERWNRADQLRLTLCLGLTPQEAKGEL